MHVSTIYYKIIYRKKKNIKYVIITFLSRNEMIGRQIVISGNDKKYIVNTSSSIVSITNNYFQI